MNFKLIILIPIILLKQSIFAQTTEYSLNKIKTIGLLIDYPVVEEKLPNSNNDRYAPLLIQANCRFPIINKNGVHQATLMVQPQFNLVKPISSNDNFIFETGINFGIAYEYYIPKKAIFFLGAGIGPHFINVNTSLQANGFIFSDNIFVGVHQILSPAWMLTYQVKFRHISNAGLQRPNVGIDNLFTGLALSYFIKK